MKKLLILLFVVPMLFTSCTGDDGMDGIDGIDGTDGQDGVNGAGGVNGADGQAGQDGVDGADGTNGTDGEDGIDGIGKVFQVKIDFNAADNFETVVEFPDEIEVTSNHVLVVFMVKNELIQEKSMSPGTGPPLPPIWEAVPTTMYLEGESLLYSFKYVPGFIKFFLDGTVNLNELPSELTQDISFRIAVLPVEIVYSRDENNLDDVIGSLNSSEIVFLN